MNILKLFLALATSATLSSCTHSGPVTEVDPCIEIPFTDGAEGACTNTVTHQAYLVDHETWIKMRPTIIMLRASDWTEIKKDWLKACRQLLQDGERCNVAVDSVDQALKQLDAILSEVIKL